MRDRTCTFQAKHAGAQATKREGDAVQVGPCIASVVAARRKKFRIAFFIVLRDVIIRGRIEQRNRGDACGDGTDT